MKALWWTSALAVLGLLVAFLAARGTPYSILVAGPSPTAPRGTEPGAAQCPPRSLPDDGVCIPVPRPVPRFDEFVQRLPNRPAPFAAYVLPVPGRAELGSWQELSAPAELAGPVVLMAPPEESDVQAVSIANLTPTLLLRAERHLALAFQAESDDAKFILVYAPLQVTLDVEPGRRVEVGSVVGQALRGGFGLSLSRLRPGKSMPSAEQALDPALGVFVDPRNHLTLIADGGASP